jgi:hypothetical protein
MLQALRTTLQHKVISEQDIDQYLPARKIRHLGQTVVNRKR